MLRYCVRLVSRTVLFQGEMKLYLCLYFAMVLQHPQWTFVKLWSHKFYVTFRWLTSFSCEGAPTRASPVNMLLYLALQSWSFVSWCSLWMKFRNAFSTLVPKLGVICDFSGDNDKAKPHSCSVLWAITAKEIFDLKCENFVLRVIRHNRYLDLGNGSKKFGNHCFSIYIFRK